MECMYIGKFNEPHGVPKKRRMVGQAREKAVSSILIEGKSCETYREMEAVRTMKQGNLKAYFSLNKIIV